MRRIATRRDGVRTTDRTGAISTDISTTIPPSVPPTRPPRPWEQRRQEAQDQSTYALNVLKQIERHLGGLQAANLVSPLGDIMRQGTYRIGSTGVWTSHWEQPYSAVAVANFTTGYLIVTNQSPVPGSVWTATTAKAPSAPRLGNGVIPILSGHFIVWPMRGNNLTIYSLTGPKPTSGFSLAVFARPRTPTMGSCGSGTF